MWIGATRKIDGIVEAIETSQIARVFVHEDKQNTVVVFACGERVGYIEPMHHFMGVDDKT